VIEKPSVKFGEALREQVEERLKFFETGEPPSRNAEAIRKVLEAIALEDQDEEGSDDEDEEEDGMKVDDSPRKDAAGFSILPLIEDSPPVEVPKKKSKKRKGDDMDVDPDEEEEVPRKKVKLSKEEKKALKKELKRKRREEEKAAGVCSFPSYLSPARLTLTRSRFVTGITEEKEGKKREEGKDGRSGEGGEGEDGEGEGWNQYHGKAAKEREEREEKDQRIVFMISTRFLLSFHPSSPSSAVSQCASYYRPCTGIWYLGYTPVITSKSTMVICASVERRATCQDSKGLEQFVTHQVSHSKCARQTGGFAA